MQGAIKNCGSPKHARADAPAGFPRAGIQRGVAERSASLFNVFSSCASAANGNKADDQRGVAVPATTAGK